MYCDYVFETTDEWPPRVSDQYINLALVTTRISYVSDEMDEFAKSSLHGTVDDLYFEKESITLEHLFKPDSVSTGSLEKCLSCKKFLYCKMKELVRGFYPSFSKRFVCCYNAEGI